MRDPDDLERWLRYEGADGEEAAAEAAFARALAALPAVQAGGDFVERTVHAGWRAGVRRRRILVLSRAVALLLFAAAGGLLASAVLGSGGAWAVRTGADLVTHSLVWLIVSVASGVDWWSSLTMIGNGVAETIVLPDTTAAIGFAVFIGGVSFYALQRLLRGGDRFQHPGTLCV